MEQVLRRCWRKSTRHAAFQDHVAAGRLDACRRRAGQEQVTCLSRGTPSLQGGCTSPEA